MAEQATPGGAATRPGLVAALVAGDLLAFLVFAAIGRRSHGAAAGLDALLAVAWTAAPFMLGWFAVAPFSGALRWGLPAPAKVAPSRGALVAALTRRTALTWLLALPLGLLLRAIFLQRGIPLSFAIVTFATNLVILCGWRAVFAWLIAPRLPPIASVITQR